MGSGIKEVESGITIGWDLGSQPRDKGSQAMGSGSGCTIFVGSETKICQAFGIKDQNLGTKLGSAIKKKKHASFRPCNSFFFLSVFSSYSIQFRYKYPFNIIVFGPFRLPTAIYYCIFVKHCGAGSVFKRQSSKSLD